MYRSAAWKVGSTALPKLRRLSLTHHHQCARRCPDSRWTETENITARVPSTSALEILIKEHLTVPSASSLTSNLNSIPTSLSVPNTTAKSVIIFDRKYRSDKAFQRMNKALGYCDCSYVVTEGNERAVVAVLGLLSLLCILTTIAGIVLILYPRLLHDNLQKLFSSQVPIDETMYPDEDATTDYSHIRRSSSLDTPDEYVYEEKGNGASRMATYRSPFQVRSNMGPIDTSSRIYAPREWEEQPSVMSSILLWRDEVNNAQRDNNASNMNIYSSVIPRESSPSFHRTLRQPPTLFDDKILRGSSPSFHDKILTDSSPSFHDNNLRNSSPLFHDKVLTESSPSFHRIQREPSASFDEKTLRQPPPSFDNKILRDSSPSFPDKILRDSSPSFHDKILRESSPSFHRILRESPPSFNDKILRDSSPSFHDKFLTDSSPSFHDNNLRNSSPSFHDKILRESSPSFHRILREPPPSFDDKILRGSSPSFHDNRILTDSSPSFHDKILRDSSPSFHDELPDQVPAPYTQRNTPISWHLSTGQKMM
ncbi:uncharacterized protein LOC134359957 isoform X2 [Mobula hypostoma]|uniref:uncharacterized protein LOC134359957 isoform X2 n=1 Tax=Mobula hypostoma TaxID=723540 RepID=UPI002FC36A88